MQWLAHSTAEPVLKFCILHSSRNELSWTLRSRQHKLVCRKRCWESKGSQQAIDPVTRRVLIDLHTYGCSHQILNMPENMSKLLGCLLSSALQRSASSFEAQFSSGHLQQLFCVCLPFCSAGVYWNGMAVSMGTGNPNSLGHGLKYLNS